MGSGCRTGAEMIESDMRRKADKEKLVKLCNFYGSCVVTNWLREIVEGEKK
jgi:hypothetical protein